MMRSSFVAFGLLASCRATAIPDAATRDPAEVPALTKPSSPQPFRWDSTNVIAPVRVTPLNHQGEPTTCVYDAKGSAMERPCDIEVTKQRDVYYRSRTEAVVARVGPELALLRPASNERVFALEPDGNLQGHGMFQPADAAQVLFCRLTDEPALRCEHRFSAAVRPRIWNETNCNASFVVTVDGGDLKVAFPAFPAHAPTIAARVDPQPTSAAAKALALFLYAMEVIDRDITMHTPYVDHLHVP